MEAMFLVEGQVHKKHQKNRLFSPPYPCRDDKAKRDSLALANFDCVWDFFPVFEPRTAISENHVQ